MATVKIIHPQSGGIAEVPESSLRFHYRAGWRPLAEDEQPAAAGPEPEPEPMTRAEVAAARDTTTAPERSEEE